MFYLDICGCKLHHMAYDFPMTNTLAYLVVCVNLKKNGLLLRTQMSDKSHYSSLVASTIKLFTIVIINYSCNK
jgi:hypothetical protein